MAHKNNPDNREIYYNRKSLLGDFLCVLNLRKGQVKAIDGTKSAVDRFRQGDFGQKRTVSKTQINNEKF